VCRVTELSFEYRTSYRNSDFTGFATFSRKSHGSIFHRFKCIKVALDAKEDGESESEIKLGLGPTVRELSMKNEILMLDQNHKIFSGIKFYD